MSACVAFTDLKREHAYNLISQALSERKNCGRKQKPNTQKLHQTNDTMFFKRCQFVGHLDAYQ